MNIVSFGGGTNSTAMIIGMYLHKIPIDLILFADTGGEQPHTYEFMGTFNEWLVMLGLCWIGAECVFEGIVHDSRVDGVVLAWLCWLIVREIEQFERKIRGDRR